MRLLRSLLICLGLVITSISPAFSQAPYITALDPDRNVCNGPANDWLRVYFNTRMDMTSVQSADNTSIHASFSGLHGRSGYGYTGNPLYGIYSVLPSGVFHPGEQVTIALMDGIMSESYVPLDHGYVWSYTVATSGGSGVFDSLQGNSVAADPHPMAVADIDGNSTLDLVVGHRTGGSISILYGNADGTFSVSPEIMVGSGPHAICPTDLNGDTWVDLVVANRYSSSLTIMLNNGDGTFASTSNISVGVNPSSLAAADFDIDGDMDIAVGNASGSVTVLFNDGTGVLGDRQDYAIPQAGVWTAFDCDGDYDMDLAVTQWSGPPDTVSLVTILFNDGSGSFGDAQDYRVGLGPGNSFAGDFDGDSDLDLAISSHYNASVSILLNNGDGTFAPRVEYPVGTGPWTVCGGDFDADNDLDLALPGFYDNNVTILRNDGQGEFVASGVYPTGEGPVTVCSGDFDLDGDLDLVTTDNSSNSVSILFNNDIGSAVEDEPGAGLPNNWSLKQNYPNPFNPRTTIEFELPYRAQVKINVLNLLGQKVRTLVDETKSAGKHRIEWDGTSDNGRPMATGIYVCRLTVGETVRSVKMLMLK